MAGFSAEWLSLREPADQVARSLALTHAVFDNVPVRPPWRILDLACGTGSNVRYLTRAIGTAAAGGTRPNWLLVDHDPALLAGAPAESGIDARCLDLSTLDDPEIFTGRSLVTASALLDLVSEA